MKKVCIIIILLAAWTINVHSQAPEDGNYDWEHMQREYYLTNVWYRYNKPAVENGDTIICYLLPEVPVYAPIKFKSARQIRKYNKLIYNVKKVLPIAQKVNRLIFETYEHLEALPDKKSKDAYIRQLEKDIKKQYTPEMKKITYSQGKLLIKLVDRECNQTSYELVKAFLGPAKAAFYQVFAWTFNASLKKTYDPECDDKMVERVVTQVEKGLL